MNNLSRATAANPGAVGRHGEPARATERRPSAPQLAGGLHRIVAVLLAATVLAIGAQAHQGMPTSKLHVSGRFLQNADGANVLLHGYMQPAASWFNGEGHNFPNPTDFTSTTNVAPALNFYKDVATIMSTTTAQYGQSHGWTASYVRFIGDHTNVKNFAPGWDASGTLSNPAQFNGWIQNVLVPYVNHCRSVGLYVVVCGNPSVAYPGGDETKNMTLQYRNNLITFWQTVAGATGIKGADNVMFEICNEPISIESTFGAGNWSSGNATAWSALKTFMQPVVDAIRTTGADNVIVVPSLGWQGECQGFASSPVSGSNIAYSGHFYPAYGDVFNDATKVQNLWNKNYKPAADIAPLFITELWWNPNDGQGYQNLWNASTSGFGNAIKSAMDGQGNVSYLIGMVGDLLANINAGLPSTTLSSGQGAQASFAWWPAYATVAVAPAITLQPASQTVTAGGAVAFTAAASGTPAPTYQWKKNGTDIAGATGATYAIASATDADAGTYALVATNSAGVATSAGAELLVNPAPRAPEFSLQPSDQIVAAGATATFSVVASGVPAPTFQWKKDGTNIPGATGASFTVASARLADIGAYTVVATNPSGSVASNSANLSLSLSATGTPPAGFDVSAYLARYPDVAAVFNSNPFAAWLYYRDVGIYEGEVFDELFRVDEYLVLYPDLAAVFGTNLGGALVHWLTEGSIEGRLGRIPLGFSAQGYFNRNPDVAAAVGNDPVLAWGHYWLYGIYEGRAYDDELRVFEYLAINNDLTVAFVNDWRQAALHWMRYGRTEGRLGRIPVIFNATEYLNRNPDVAATWGTNPTTDFLHYWLYGLDEGRTFDDHFRAGDYLTLNPDLAVVFGTDLHGAFKHWARYGQAEGRPAKLP